MTQGFPLWRDLTPGFWRQIPEKPKPGLQLGPMGMSGPICWLWDELPGWLNGGRAQTECQNVHWLSWQTSESRCLLGDMHISPNLGFV